MTIYNSQRVNNDPQPYCVYVNHQRTHVYVSSDEEVTLGFDGDLDLVYDPRPKYHNTPNPVLEAFRNESDWDWLNEEGKETEVREWLWWLSDKSHNIYLFQKHEHIEHAHRVLTKLINVYKETA